MSFHTSLSWAVPMTRSVLNSPLGERRGVKPARGSRRRGKKKPLGLLPFMRHFELDAFGLKDAPEPAVPSVHVQLELLLELCQGNHRTKTAASAGGAARSPRRDGDREQSRVNYPPPPPNHANDSQPDVSAATAWTLRVAPLVPAPSPPLGKGGTGHLPGESVFLTTLVLSL